jgi:hypothetical protein
MTEAVAPAKKTKHRSPAYPSISLKTAIERAASFYMSEKRNAAPVSVAVKHWDYKEKSSGGIQTIAALKSYGLMSDSGSSKARKVQLSELGLAIVMDERVESPERDELIKKAALMPKIHARLWTDYKTDLPSEENLRHRLRVDQKFNDNVVDDFIREYKDTIKFAKLAESDKVASEDGSKEDTGSAGPYIPKLGDYVQWEPRGILKFETPKRVTEICSDGKHALVEGSYTGFPISELTLQKTPVGSPHKPESSIPLPPNKLMQEFVVPLSEGNRAVFQWPVTLTMEDIADLKDSLKILERKITRSITNENNKEKSA